MSFDEYCLEQLSSEDSFFYLWRNRPAVIIGLNQNAYSEVNILYLEDNGITLARRVTGGGAVYHDLQNLNYTFIGKDVSPQPIVDALRTMGVDAELSGRNDIFVEGKKVSGYARRVWHDRQMVHGTLMYDVDLEPLTRALDVDGSKMSSKGIASVRSRVGNLKAYLPQHPTIEAFRDALQELLAGSDEQMAMSPEQLEQVRSTAESKFASWEWVYGSSHEADFSRSARLACGTVEVSVKLDRGCICAIEFRGDFLGGLPVAQLEDALKGRRFERGSLLECLKELGVERYFDSVSAEDIAGMLF